MSDGPLGTRFAYEHADARPDQKADKCDNEKETTMTTTAIIIAFAASVLGAIVGGVIGSGLISPWRQHKLAQRREADKFRAAFRSYFEPIVNHYETEDACAIQAVYSAGPNFMDWNEFIKQTKAVREYVHGNAVVFDRACNFMEGISFGEYGDRPKNEAAKKELVRRMKKILSFAK